MALEEQLDRLIECLDRLTQEIAGLTEQMKIALHKKRGQTIVITSVRDESGVGQPGIIAAPDTDVILGEGIMSAESVPEPALSGGIGASVTLEIGSGWTQSTASPGPVGDASNDFYDAQAIARWDVVPLQILDADGVNHSMTMKIGVMAFHASFSAAGDCGIGRVDFSADNGPWVSATDCLYNNESGEYEFWCTLDANSWADGVTATNKLVEIRAIIYPNSGVPRILQGTLHANTVPSRWDGANSMYINVNGDMGGTVIDEDVVELAAGTHNLDGIAGPATPTKWKIWRPQAGQSKATVTIDGPAGITEDALNAWTGHIKLENVTINGNVIPGNNNASSMWLDNCDVVGDGRANSVAVLFGRTIRKAWFYHTGGGEYTDCRHVFNSYHPLVRGVSLLRIGGDGIRNHQLMVNCYHEDHGPPQPTGEHDDPVHTVSEGPKANSIYYRNYLDDIGGQFLFTKNDGQEPTNEPTYYGTAIVNNIWAKGTYVSGLHAPRVQAGHRDHIVLWSNSWIRNNTAFLGTGTHNGLTINYDHCSAIGNVFRGIVSWAIDNAPNRLVDHNHFEQAGDVKGSNTSTGDPAYIDPDNETVTLRDYRPDVGSPLVHASFVPPVPADNDNVARPATGAAVGGLEPA